MSLISGPTGNLPQATRIGAWIVASMLALAAWPGHAEEPERTLHELFASVDQSVVLVRTLEAVPIANDGIILRPVGDLGSGVLISKEGDVLTAAHLVQVADAIQVEFVDGSTAEAKVIASDPAADLALLRVSQIPKDVVVARLGDSDAVRVGQRVFVIGAPYGLSHTLSVGHVSARHPPGTPGRPFRFGEFFQVDVAVHKGNSGGPMFNMNGDVIAIVSHLLGRSDVAGGIGFAVTSKSIRELIFERRAPWSGISVFGLDGNMAKIFNLPQETGLLVQRVARDSPGARLGLLPSFLPAKIGRHELMLGGDIILEVDGIQVGTFESYLQLRRRFAKIEKGQTVTVKVLRHSQVLELTTILDE